MLMIADESRWRAARVGRFGGWADGQGWPIALMLLAVFTFAVRARFFGDPIIDSDEQFYLLAGDRLLHGAIPYVDIWDRKPLGLFVLYAGIRLLGGDGILAYQLIASAFAAGTAIFIAILARRIATPGTALVVAAAYAPLIGLSGGMGGQTPVFYNLPVAAAALLTMRCYERERNLIRMLRRQGAGAMLLIGLAMQLKPTVLFEGLFFGSTLLWLSWQASHRPGRLLIDASVWMGAALAPTAIAALAYTAIGHADAFVYANFGSIFARGGIGAREAVHNLGLDLGRLTPLIALIAIGEWLLRSEAAWADHSRTRHAHAFLGGWAASAVSGFLIFGSYFNHYALPLIPPLAVMSAPALTIRTRRVGPVLAAILLVTSLVWYIINAGSIVRRTGSPAYGYQLAARIRPLLGPGRCLYIFYGEPIYYHLTNSCLLTRWPFPYHLSLTREADALGVDPLAEMQHILAQRPAVILDAVTTDDGVNPATHAILRKALQRDYRLIYSHTKGGHTPNTDQLWERLPDR